MLNKRKLGAQGLEVSAIGPGCMGMSHDYGTPNDAKSMATIHRAIELGCIFLDTDEVGELNVVLAPGTVAEPRYTPELMSQINR